MTDTTDTSPEAVERWDIEPDGSAWPHAEGDFVRYEDYAALSAERDALRAQVERAETALKWYSQQVSIMSKATIDAGWALDRLKADRGAVYAKYLKSRHQKETGLSGLDERKRT